MRVGIVSDIHCNITGLELALEHMGEIDELWCAGDAVFQYRWSNDVIRRLRDYGAYVVLGNHEDVILGRDGIRALSNPAVDQDLVTWLREQPYRLTREVGGKVLMMTHGSPWEPWDDYHYPHDNIWKQSDELGCDVLIVGHTHFKMAKKFERCTVINPGSTGDPRDPNNEFHLSCAVYDTTTDDVTFYDYWDPARRRPPSTNP